MTKFKKGDRVAHDRYDFGTVMTAANDTSVLVEFIAPQHFFHDGNNGDGPAGKPGHCYWVHENELRLAVVKPTKTFSPSSQCGKLLVHLAGGRSITPLQAFGTLGVYRLAARIHELKQAGHKIISTMKMDEMGKTYASYSLKSRRFV